MMSTSRASRPSKDKTKTQLQNVKSDSQLGKNQATAEQMRIAELIQDKMSGADPEVKAKISQVIDVTGRSVDEALVALHDCDNDPTRAINMLLEGVADQGEWQESGKKKKKQVQIKPEVTNHKGERAKSEDRQDDKIHDRDRDRDSMPPRRGKQPPRLARKMRENEENERNRNESGSRDRGFDRGFERGRGRGRGQANGAGRGRGRGRRGDRGGGNRFERSQGPAIGTWTNETAENAEKENSMNTWDGAGEDWGDEWTGSLEETKVFTATSTGNKVFEDNKVFNSSDSSNVFNSNDSKVFGHNEPSKVFGTGIGDNDAKMFQVPGHSDSLETQVFSASMSSMANSNSAGSALNDSTNTLHTATSLQNSISQNSLGQPSTLGQRLDLGLLLQKPSSTDRDSVSQQQSQFMTQFQKHATEMLKNDLRIGTSSSNHGPSSGGGEPSLGQQPASQSANNKTQCSQAVGMKQKPQKSKLPPPSKIPASAVEMPGHLGGNFQLDVQFGNWDFNTGDSGFTFGGSSSDSTSGVSSSFSSTPSSVTTSSSPLSSHSLSNKNGSDASVMTTVMSTVVTTKTSVTGLDSIAQNPTQSPRGANMYQGSNSTTPSKEYPTSNKMSPPAAIPYSSGQSDRKMSPHYSQRPSSATSSSSHISQSKQGSSPASMNYTQNINNYTTSYQTSSYQSSGKPSPTSSYSHSAGSGSLSNSGLSAQNQYNHSSYQSTSYPSQNAFSPSQQSLGHYSSGQSNSYPGQGSYQGQSSAYHSRDQPSSNAYQNSNSQSASYQGSSQNSSYNSGTSQSGSYPRDSQSGPSAYSSHQTYASTGHQNSLQSSSMSNKLNDSLNKMSLKDSALDSHQSSSQYDHTNSTNSTSLTTSSNSTTVNSLGSNSANVSTALGLTTTVVTSPVMTTSTTSSKATLPMTTSKAPPNLPPGVPPLISHNYMLAGQPGPGMPFAFANLTAQGLAQQPMYSYEDLQMLQQRLPMPGYYDMPFQPPTTMSRDQGLTNVPYSDGKISRLEAQSPTVQTSQQQQQTAQQQQFINPTLPPGYNLNYYYAGGVVPGGYSYTPTVFPVPPVTNAAHAGSTGNPQFQKPGAFTGGHAYGTGYDDLSSQPQDFTKTYGASAQTQNKGSGSVAVTSATSDISAAAYGKSHTQSFDKTGFPGGTPPPFNMLPTGSQGGPLGAPAAYGTTYVPVMAHQAHSQMLHHHLQQDSTGGSSRGSQQTATQGKAAASKSYGPYWGGS